MKNSKTDQSYPGQKDTVSPETGRLFVISAPSGTGKTTLCKALLKRFPDIRFSVSYTTRKPRSGEQDGIDYYFLAKDDFKKKLEHGQFAEWATVYGHYYGTPAEFIDKKLASGFDILLDIDVKGTIQILDRYPDCVTIFIIPPSPGTLKARLKKRNTDSKETIKRRLADAENEMTKKDLYRHTIVNDRLSSATDQLISIVEKYRIKSFIV